MALSSRTRKQSTVDESALQAKEQLIHQQMQVTDDGTMLEDDSQDVVMEAKTLKITDVRDGTKVMQNAGVDSKVVDLAGTDWMPTKGTTYGATVKFGDNGIERFAMIFGKVNASNSTYKSISGVTHHTITSTGEVMLLATNLGQDNAQDEDWENQNITITIIAPVPRPSPATHSNIIAHHGKAKDFAYDQNCDHQDGIPFDLTKNEEVLREKLITDLSLLKPVLAEITKDQSIADDMTYFSC